MKPFAWEYPPFFREREKTKIKPRQTSDTSTAYISWDTQQHRTNVSNLNMSIKLEVWNLTDRRNHHFSEKRPKKNEPEPKQATWAQPPFPKSQSNTEQMLAISISALNLKYGTLWIDIITCFSNRDEKIRTRNKKMISAQPRFPERESNTKQMLVTSKNKFIEFYETFLPFDSSGV